MSIESDSDDSTDIFWPGYVDAVTNLVLNLLFVLTIMIVAVFMFALELSRHKEQAIAAVVAEHKTKTEDVMQEKEQEIAELQKEVERLKANAQMQNKAILQAPSSSQQKVATVKTLLPKPEKDIDKLLEDGGGVLVKFVADAVTLNEAEVEQVQKLLKPIVARGHAKLIVDAPAGFSEAKRIALYRVMAVRNELIKMGVPPAKLEVKIREGKSNADNSKVLVAE